MDERYDRLRVLWPDHLGLARGKYVPARLADRGARHCAGVWALGYDGAMEPGTTGSHYYDGLPDMVAAFDPDAIRPGWEDRTGVVVADLEEDGQPVSVSPRAALRRAVAAWTERGLTPVVGIELEAYLLEPDGAGGWRPLDTPGAFVYGTGAAVDPGGVISDIWATAHEGGSAKSAASAAEGSVSAPASSQPVAHSRVIEEYVPRSRPQAPRPTESVCGAVREFRRPPSAAVAAGPRQYQGDPAARKPILLHRRPKALQSTGV